jgi:predicted acetyltransferase
MSAATYQVEDYLTVLPEMRKIFPEHWEEIGNDGIKVEPNYSQYENMAKAGVLHMVTMRVDGELAGYHVSMVAPHMHSASCVTAFTDFFFVRKAHRRGMRGYRLLKFMRDSLFARGVQKIYMGTKLYLDIGPLLDRLGFAPIERLYTIMAKQG